MSDGSERVEAPPAGLAPEPQPIWLEPVRGGHPDPALFGLSGRGQLEALLSGRVSAPPMSRLTGVRLSGVGSGSASFVLPLSEWLASPQGPVSLGVVTIAADAAMACSIQSELSPATPFSTSELSLRMLAPVHPGGTLTATGRLISLRQTIALAEVSVHDEGGELVAHGSSICVLAPALSPAPLPPAADGPTAEGLVGQEAEGAEADPHLRPARGAVLGQEVWESLGGLDVLMAQLAGKFPAPPVHHLTGLTLTDACEGETSFTMPASQWLCAPPRGRVQGGFVAMLGDAALCGAIQSRLPPNIALAPIDLKVNYLRPLPADGRVARADGRVVNLGRRVAVAEATVLDADERPIAVATGSALLLPGRATRLCER